MMAGIENIDSSSENTEWLIGEPLDTLQMKVSGRFGVEKAVSALHIGFMEVREFMHFKSLSAISSDTGQQGFTADEEEFFECMSFLEDDLHWLLRLPHHRFWSQVVYDESLHKCLESYLTLAPRDYDIVHLKLKEEVHTVLKKIHRLVFLVFLRMSTYKESKEHHIRKAAYGDIIYENFVFDVPKLMDLCVLYGFQNKAVLTKMIKNIFTSQPKYSNDLTETCAVALGAFGFAEEKLFLNVPEKHGGCRKLEDNTPSGIKDMSLPAFCNVIGYIADTCATIHMFLEIYSPACQVFYQNGAIIRIAGFYEQTFSAVEKEIKRLSKANENDSVLQIIREKVMLSKTFLIKTFRNMLSYCCIQHILDPSCAEERSSNNPPADEFLEIFMEIACEKNFLNDYNNVYPFESDLELLTQTGTYLDPERLSYVFGSIHDITDESTQPFTSKAKNGARPKIHSKNFDKSVTSLHSIAAILKPEAENPYENGTASSEYLDDSHSSELQMDSLIQVVLELFPHLGEGFIEDCITHFCYDTEKVIDALCTDALPKCLDELDRSLQRKPKALSSSTNNSNPSSILTERKNVFDNDEFDVFNRDDVNMKNIHIGKKNKTPNSYQSLETEEESEFLKKLICAYGEQESDDETDNGKINLYEDEYDDTYDSALVGLKEPILQDEPDKDEPPEENTTEGAREPRPDDFCINPEIQRQRYEEHRQAKAASRNRDGRGGAPSSQNRHQKDRNKAHVGNHNRKKQADFKKSRGMFPTR